MTPRFSLHDAGGALLCELPPGIGIGSELGAADPFEWDRAPGSPAWFPLGDGLSRERPQLILTGRHVYREGRDAALTDAALIHQSLRRARSLQWGGRPFAALRSDLSGECRVRYGDRAYDLTYTLTLNLTAPLTPETLQEAQQR